MIGIYQAYNASLVIIAVERLRHKGYKISNDDIKKGFLNARWQGRFELIHKRPDIILDGGHNPEGIQSAIDSIKKIYPSKKIHFLVGMMADKDIRSMLLPTKDIAIDYVTVMPDNYRALSSKKLADILSDMGCKVYAATSIEDGIIKLINSMTEDDIACCIGSLYMVADIRKYVAITAKG